MGLGVHHLTLLFVVNDANIQQGKGHNTLTNKV